MRGLIDSKVKSYVWRHFPVQRGEFVLSVAEFRRKHDRVTMYIDNWIVGRTWPADLQFWMNRWANTRFNMYLTTAYTKWTVPRGEVKPMLSEFTLKPEGPPPQGWPWEAMEE